jgi:hypothetical protein
MKIIINNSNRDHREHKGLKQKIVYYKIVRDREKGKVFLQRKVSR